MTELSREVQQPLQYSGVAPEPTVAIVQMTSELLDEKASGRRTSRPFTGISDDTLTEISRRLQRLLQHHGVDPEAIAAIVQATANLLEGKSPAGRGMTTVKGHCSRRHTSLADITNMKKKQNRVRQLKVRLQQLLTSDGPSVEVTASAVLAAAALLDNRRCTMTQPQGHESKPAETRMSAPANPSRQVLLNNLAAIHESKEAWLRVRAIKQEDGVYRNSTERVKKSLLQGISIAEWRHGAFFDPVIVISFFLKLAATSHVLHSGTHPLALCVFLDAKKM